MSISLSGVFFGTFLFFHILRIITPADWYFSEGLKPPTSYGFIMVSSQIFVLCYPIHNTMMPLHDATVSRPQVCPRLESRAFPKEEERRLVRAAHVVLGTWLMAAKTNHPNMITVVRWLNLVGGLAHDFYFSILIGNVIIPTDETIFFRGVGQPPISIDYP